MNKFLGFLFLISLYLPNSGQAQDLVIDNNVRFLALGDSYTIGESVLEKERWPNQLADRLLARGLSVDEVKIVARTGWTTRNLITELEANSPTFDYTLVSLLIGVNDQFQGRTQTQYQVEFDLLLNMALAYAKNNSERVFVLSIPDYGFTPFGQNYPNASKEIDEFNAINRSIADNYNVTYIDATSTSRIALDQPELLAGDQLHPSAKMYSIWVDSVLNNATLENIITDLHNNKIELESSIYPNPATDVLNLPVGTTFIEISDHNGRIVYLNEELTSKTFDVKFLAQGNYFLKIIVDKDILVSKFLKQ